MAVKVRLERIGKRNQPSYRVIVTDRRSRRDGKHIEIVGFYNPNSNPPVVTLKKDRIDHWIKNGAIPSDTVRTLLS